MNGDKIFLDSNILCYAADFDAKEKQLKAERIVQTLNETHSGFISTQVLQETYSVITKKLKYPYDKAKRYIERASALNVHENTVSDIMTAIDISEMARISFWDALVVTAALRCSCAVLYSEDLNASQTIAGVKVVNPFE